MSEVQQSTDFSNNYEKKKSDKLLKFKLEVEIKTMNLMGVNSDETAMKWVNENMDIFREIFDKETAKGFESLEVEVLAQKIKNQIISNQLITQKNDNQLIH